MAGKEMETVNTNRRVVYVPRPPKYDPSVYFTPFQKILRECTQWDQRGNRFLVSNFHGGLGAVPFKPGSHASSVKEEVLVHKAPYPSLSNLGFRLDYPRNRVVCCATDKTENFALSTVVAYDYTTWKTLFVLVLQSGKDRPSLADDLAIDPQGNIYVTDAKNGKLWKVQPDGSDFRVFCDHPLFQMEPQSDRYKWVKLNGIVYHPKGFLLVGHMGASTLFKVSMDGKTVTEVEGLVRELLGDGMVLLDDNRLVMSGLNAGVHILATTDNWETAIETHWSPPPLGGRTLPSSVSLKDGLPFVGYVHLDFQLFNTIACPPFMPLG